jgi:drug/metabolite transporter (DMT)-like permease
MGLCLCGVGVLNGFNTGRHATLLGNFIVFLSAASFAAFTILGKRATRQHSSLTVTTFAYTGSAIGLAPVTLWFWPRFAFHVSTGAWVSVIFMALFPALIAYLIYYYALTYIPASRLSQFTYLQPLLATLMAVPLLGEHLTASVLAGGALVLGGVWVAERM